MPTVKFSTETIERANSRLIREGLNSSILPKKSSDVFVQVDYKGKIFSKSLSKDEIKKAFSVSIQKPLKAK